MSNKRTMLVTTQYAEVALSIMCQLPQTQSKGKATDSWRLVGEAMRYAPIDDLNRFIMCWPDEMSEAVTSNHMHLPPLDSSKRRPDNYRHFHLLMSDVMRSFGQRKADHTLRDILTKAYSDRFESEVTNAAKPKSKTREITDAFQYSEERHNTKLWRFTMNAKISSHQAQQTTAILFNVLGDNEVEVIVTSDQRFVSEKSDTRKLIDMDELPTWSGNFADHEGAAVRWLLKLKKGAWAATTCEFNRAFAMPTPNSTRQVADDAVRAIWGLVTTGATDKYPGAQGDWSKDGKPIMKASILSGLAQRTIAQQSGEVACYFVDGSGNLAYRTKLGKKMSNAKERTVWAIDSEIPEIVLACFDDDSKLTSSAKAEATARANIVSALNGAVGKAAVAGDMGLVAELSAFVKTWNGDGSPLAKTTITPTNNDDQFDAPSDEHPVTYLLRLAGETAVINKFVPKKKAA